MMWHELLDPGLFIGSKNAFRFAHSHIYLIFTMFLIALQYFTAAWTQYKMKIVKFEHIMHPISYSNLYSLWVLPQVHIPCTLVNSLHGMPLTLVTVISYLLLTLLSFQVNNLLQVAQKYQAVVNESGSAGISNNDAQTICNMLVILFHLQYLISIL